MHLAARTLYRKLLRLYPQRFKEQFSESMEQTFNDLYKEQQREPDILPFVFGTFIETSAGIVREHIHLIRKGDSMKAMLSNPTSAAIVSLILSLPLTLLYVIFNLDIKIFNLETRSLTELVTSWLTVNGSDVNGLGRLVLVGGLLLLPVAFVINLRPMLKKVGPQAKRTLHTANVIVGIIILMIILVTWGGLLVEGIYCLQEIRCD